MNYLKLIYIIFSDCAASKLFGVLVLYSQNQNDENLRQPAVVKILGVRGLGPRKTIPVREKVLSSNIKYSFIYFDTTDKFPGLFCFLYLA